MSFMEIVYTVRSAGGYVRVEFGDLKISAPAGLLTNEDKRLLRESKPDLIRLLAAEVDPYEAAEREAIVWSETAPAAELDAALDQAKAEWSRLVDSREERTHEFISSMETALGDTLVPVQVADQDVAEPVPCLQCGSLLAWWDATGGVHCQQCQPMDRSERVLIHAEQIRQRNYRRVKGEPRPFRKRKRLHAN